MLLTESLALHRHVGDRQATASTLNNLAETAAVWETRRPPWGCYRESHSLALEGGNRLYAAIAMEGLAALDPASRRRKALPKPRFREALLLYRSVSDKQGIASCLGGLAAVAASQGRARKPRRFWERRRRICDEHDELDSPGLAEAVDSLRSTMGDEVFEAAWQSGRAMAIDQVMDQIAAQTRSNHAAPGPIALNPAEACRSDLDVRDHPLDVPRDQIPRCFVEERVVAGLPCCAFTRGRGIDLDLDPVQGGAWRPPSVAQTTNG